LIRRIRGGGGGITPQSYGGITPQSYSFKKGGGRGKSQLTWAFVKTDNNGQTDANGVVILSDISVKGVPSIQGTITGAFNVWAAALPGTLGFTQVSRGAYDIDIGTQDLGGRNPADGSLKLGDTRVASIRFSSNSAATYGQYGQSLLGVAIHEIGHALGLGHATTSNSVMFSLGPPPETLSSDDIAGLRALYGWSNQSLLEGGTECHPALCACGDTLALAWRGAGGDTGIWFATSSDGVNWTSQRPVLSTGTTDGPSLAWDGVKKLWMAWRGTTGDDALYYATTTDFRNWTDFSGRNPIGLIPNTGSSHGPRIAIVAGGVPILVWKGAGDTGIYWSTFNSSTGQWQPQQKIPGVGTTASPAICPDLTDVARILWRGTADDDALYTTVAFGTPLLWQPQQQVTWISPADAFAGEAVGTPGSKDAPCMSLATGPKIVAAWRGVPDDHSLYFTQIALDNISDRPLAEWSQQSVVPNVGSSHGPALADFKGNLRLVWKGLPGDDSMYIATL
jgi:Matrixin